MPEMVPLSLNASRPNKGARYGIGNAVTGDRILGTSALSPPNSLQVNSLPSQKDGVTSSRGHKPALNHPRQADSRESRIIARSWGWYVETNAHGRDIQRIQGLNTAPDSYAVGGQPSVRKWSSQLKPKGVWQESLKK